MPKKEPTNVAKWCYKMANEQISSEGIEVIISYSHKDEMLRDELEKHLSILKRQKPISTWYDRKIGAGEEWMDEIDKHMDSAQIVLLLISADFLASDYCYDIELKRAMERHESGEARVIPIILRPVDWKGAPFGKLQALPTNAEPIVSKKWGCTDEAFVDIVRGLRDAIGSFRPKKETKRSNSRTSPNGSSKKLIVDQMHRGDCTTINASIAMAERRPMAYISYAHVDDKFNKGYLAKFCECLSGEVSLHLGEEFPIFLDRKDIKWVDAWKERIEDHIYGTTFLIPIITPSFFKSQYCRDELSRFLEIEQKLGRSDLILPVYFIETPHINDESKKNEDELAQIITSRQYADWRTLRFEDLDSRAVRRALAELAGQIRDTLDSLLPASEEPAPKSEPPAPHRRETEPPWVVVEALNVPEHSSTIVVDKMGRGDFETISKAIDASDPGSRILIKSGIYDEALILDKPLEIVGSGNLGEVVIRAEGKNAILFRSAKGIVSNLVLQQVGGGDFYCVDIQQGVLVLEGCDIISNSLACVAIHGKAFPKLRGNKIHDGKASGIYVRENGQGLIEDNDIFGNALAGIVIKEAGNPTVRGNKIHDGKDAGIFVYGNGRGLVEYNDIFGNALSGISIKEAGSPIVRGNRINKNGLSAVTVSEKGAGIIENNDLRDNENGAWLISDDSKNLVKRSGNQE